MSKEQTAQPHLQGLRERYAIFCFCLMQKKKKRRNCLINFKCNARRYGHLGLATRPRRQRQEAKKKITTTLRVNVVIY
jgi:hypothetical protein